jgi:uncharacterized membrane protein
MTNLGTLDGGESIAEAISLPRELVGRSSPTGSASLNDGSTAYGWSSGTGPAALGTLGAAYDDAVASNTRGQIAGQSQTVAGATHAGVWRPRGCSRIRLWRHG